jgi:hypothetical protein
LQGVTTPVQVFLTEVLHVLPQTAVLRQQVPV